MSFFTPSLDRAKEGAIVDAVSFVSRITDKYGLHTTEAEGKHHYKRTHANPLPAI